MMDQGIVMEDIEMMNESSANALLKSRVKLQQQDKIWKDICGELNWQYIPSI
mgnify:CR=1 FL=1